MNFGNMIRKRLPLGSSVPAPVAGPVTSQPIVGIPQPNRYMLKAPVRSMPMNNAGLDRMSMMRKILGSQNRFRTPINVGSIRG